MANTVNPGQPRQAFINQLMGGNDFQQKHVVEMHGRTAIITGGTRGIGYEVSKSLALAGARVIMVSRKPENGDEAIQAVRQAASEVEGHDGKIDLSFVACDFGNLNAVRDLAAKLNKEEERIDILINDAGIGIAAYELDDNGIERIFGVNVVGHFYFINRILPALRRTAQKFNITPRLISLTSNLHKATPSSTRFASLEEINTPGLRSDVYYDRSKLAIILYIKQLVSRAIEPYPEKIIALSVHPGAVATEIQEQIKEAFGSILGTVLLTLQKPLLRNVDEGSLGTLWAAVSPEVEEKGYQGVYISDPGVVGGETEQAKSEELGVNVWNLCEGLIKKTLGADAMLSWGEGSKGA
ncbi:NAD(P)-binding protein [Exidia glandulosa HHB12029]|uniref:NAD(P)-binding protein n=1 Tax=Exidia glandulosa HHB12029 TaxID=1314781 RepID=A0A165D7D9_EXIGL|nr:NAD(P)-binding protein [Exidia glandulosa HHB12029]